MKTHCLFTFLTATLLFAISPLALPAADVAVDRSEVKGESFVADFYHKEGSSNLAGILFLGGSEGGRPDRHLPEVFAEQGYPVLAVAYFKEAGLPKTLQMIPLEYFDKAIAWMNHQDQIRHPGIVIIGASKGAELAFLILVGGFW